jgi:acyl-CoA thioesterase-1
MPAPALDRQQAAVVDAVDVLAALGQAQVVGDQHQRGAAAGVEFEQQVADVLAGGVVQRAGRFVGEQDARAGDEGTCQRHALLLATGQLARVVAGAMGQADLGQHLVHPRGPRGRPVPAAARRSRRRSAPAAGGSSGTRSRPRARAAGRAFVQVAQILAGQRDAAAAGQVQPGQQAEQGGLAGTGADDGHAGAFMDGQGDVVQYVDFTLRALHGLADLVDGDGDGRCGGQAVDEETPMRKTGWSRRAGAMMVLLLGFLLLPGLACRKVRPAPCWCSATASVLPTISRRRRLGQPAAAAGQAAVENPARIVNASMSGDHRRRAPAGPAGEGKPTVVIALGGNDALRGLTPAQVQGNLEKMVQASQKAGARVLLLGIDVPPNYGQRLAYALATQYKVPLLPFLLEAWPCGRA